MLHGRQFPPQIYYEGSPQAVISESLLIGAFYIKSLSITCTPALQEPISNELGKVILSLPKLERLILKQVANRYWRDNSTPISPTFRLDVDSKLPPSLRILSLANFTFDEEQAISWARCITECDIQHLRLDGYLQISVLLKALTGSVPGLKSFASRVISEPDVLRSHGDFLAILDCFLQSITNLECFTSNDIPKEVLTSVIRHHGNHLRQLRFRQTSSMASILPRSEGKICLFSLEEIVQLSNGLAQVERLGLDLFFKDPTPYDYLEALARFPSLKYLELNTPNFCAVPSLGESIIKEAFHVEREQCA
ncbi:hypothetical protein ASPCAL04891 [Aspergillus calidoustus]|uniref:F-box domain-containing protein n=1 Tax=Aspergillus calidoustus TaxID=454130 RepID=A0A0U5FW34_ASPCI|nr:hypothetical protein ASPCAL04891 [Aspergillus calidoustus]